VQERGKTADRDGKIKGARCARLVCL